MTAPPAAPVVPPQEEDTLLLAPVEPAEPAAQEAAEPTVEAPATEPVVDLECVVVARTLHQLVAELRSLPASHRKDAVELVCKDLAEMVVKETAEAVEAIEPEFELEYGQRLLSAPGA